MTLQDDISTRQDVERLIDTFYAKVKESSLIAYIFNDIAKIDWDKHLPIMYSFWSSILLGEHSYEGNPMHLHIQLSKQVKLSDTEFSEWLKLFGETVDELFRGPKADEAKIRAANIARLMLHKIKVNTTG